MRELTPNEEDFIFLVGCTDMGAVGGGDSELFSAFPNSYNNKISSRSRHTLDSIANNQEQQCQFNFRSEKQTTVYLVIRQLL